MPATSARSLVTNDLAIDPDPGVDPTQTRSLRAYLDQYLTEDELREGLRMPPRSKAEVDCIVELIDEHGACDAELRNLVYEAFSVSDQ